VRLTPRAVEIFLKGERIAAHLRASGNHRHTTVPEQHQLALLPNQCPSRNSVSNASAPCDTLRLPFAALPF
jgi:hypothetical protein